MSRIVSLLSLYLRSPALLVRHTEKAAGILRQRGIGDLSKTIRERLSPGSDRIVQLLARSIENEKHNTVALQNALTPYASDLKVLDIVEDPHERVRLLQCHILKTLGILDEDYYRKRYLSKALSTLPADHYFRHGREAGLPPNPHFDPGQYLTAYADVADTGMDPVIHYALFGWKEGRRVGVDFDPDYYLAQNPDVVAAGMSPFSHYLLYGRKEGRTNKPGISDHKTQTLEERTFTQTRGTLVLVSHDAELGGAQQVVKILASWLQIATRFEVKFVIMRGGPFAHTFAKIAPTFNASAYPESELTERLRVFAGPDVKVVLVNSIASVNFLQHWDTNVAPAVAFIHELPKILDGYPENISLLREKAAIVIGGSAAVCNALRNRFAIPPERLELVYGFIEKIDEEDRVRFDEKAAAKKALGLDPKVQLVTACGVLHWRKSPKIFIEVAEKVILGAGRKVRFVWIGDGPDMEECKKLVAEKGLDDVVSFTGYEPVIMRWLKASDVFLLPSEEDPFPLVCLYAAMALNPVICFKGAGGMQEFVAKGCGAAVKFGDAGAMASSLLDYLDDDNHREAEGENGRSEVVLHHSITAAGPQLLHHLRTAAGLAPHVSVIVPNYNYESYLSKRLDSILDQTFQDFELILLDDKSSDNSVAVMQQYANRRVGSRLIVNNKNSGSPFKQWLLGIREAKSDLLWIAEADDMAEPVLLETLLPHFDDRNVFLGYVQSVPIDAMGKTIGNYEDLYLNRIMPGRWSTSYVATDHQEANRGLGIANCIPNASSVIFRRFDPEPDFVSDLTSMKICGDWLFYLRAMRGGLVAYAAKDLNYHRRHTKTVTHSMEGSTCYFEEFNIVRNYVSANYKLSEQTHLKIESFTIGDLDRFGIEDKGERDNIIRLALQERDRRVPSVAYVVSDLSPGGGQAFVIGLANNWMRRGGRAILINTHYQPNHHKVMASVDARVAVFNSLELGQKLDTLVADFDIDLVHTSMWWSESMTLDALAAYPDVPWVTSMHGCHETILDHPVIDLTFSSKFCEVLKRVDQWVYTAEKNTRVFEKFGWPDHLDRISNGMEVKTVDIHSREKLGLREGALVLCLATRAIAEKGWFEAVKAVEELNRAGHKVDLMLLGEGPAATAIVKRKPANVHLYGHVLELQRYIGAADVGLLPSYFVGESMPLVLIEMMGMGKPIIASDAGEIPNLVGSGPRASGIIVPIENGTIPVEALKSAIKRMTDNATRRKYAKSALKRYKDGYTMEDMVGNYAGLYGDVLARRAAAGSESAQPETEIRA